jgi:toxin-antitoxin system PIN domain toxin
VILPDVNVLLYAFRTECPEHPRYREWLLSVLEGNSAYGVSPQTLAAVIRISTNKRIYKEPASIHRALQFAGDVLAPAICTVIVPGPRHWEIFTRLCRDTDIQGDLVQDAWYAALAIEHGCEWITLDRDYARFPGLRWRTPF